MTEEEIRANIVEVSILNDLIEIRLKKLTQQDLRHKTLEKALLRSFKASNGLTVTMDKKLGDKRAEAFGDMYDEADNIFTEISSHFIK